MPSFPRPKSKLVRFGIPMVLFSVVGFAGLTRVRTPRAVCRPRCASLQVRYRLVYVAHSSRPVPSPSPEQFMSGKYETVDRRVKKRSERSVHLEQAHKAIVGRLQLDDYEIRPVPRPPADK